MEPGSSDPLRQRPDSQPAGQRSPRDDGHVVLPARGQDVGLDPADEDRVRRLLADEALQAPVARDPLRLDNGRGREGRGAEVADLALLDEVGERSERLVEIGVRVVAVDLVEVDPVRLEPPQRVLDLMDDPAARVAAAVRIVAHRHVHLAREHDVVAAPGERLADDLLRLALRVDVGGVDEVDPGVEGRVDDPDRLVVVGVAPGAEHHRAEAQLADRDAGAPQGSVFHRRSPQPAAGAAAYSSSVT